MAETIRSSLATPEKPFDALRVATYNIGDGGARPDHLLALFRFQQLDVLALQESFGSFSVKLRNAFPDSINIECKAELCLISPWPVSSLGTVNRRSLGGWGQVAAAFQLQVRNATFHIVNVHLDRPRPLELLFARDGGLFDGLAAARTAREQESVLALKSSTPRKGKFLALGDFNMPQESDVYRTYWGQFTNAFDTVGFGLGNTVSHKFLAARIDHVLLGESLEPTSATVIPGLGGDHRPLVVDIVF